MEYTFLTEEDKAFLRPETTKDKKLENLTLQQALKDLSKKLITYEKDKTLTFGQLLALKFFKECYEHPTAKNMETYAKLIGEFKDNVDVNVNTATELFSCKVDDKTE